MMITTLLNILTSPAEAFVDIKAKPRVLFPLLLILLSLCGAQLYYYMSGDPEFLMAQIIEQAIQTSNTPEDQIRAGLSQSSPTGIGIFAAISVMVALSLLLLIYAGYLSLISKFTNDGIRYKQWLSLSCWTGIPVIFTALAQIVIIITDGDGLIGLDQLPVLSFNNLLFQTQGEFKGLLQSLNVPQIWSMALTFLGYRNWTGLKGGKSAAIVMLPYVLIYGIWALTIIL